MNKINIIAQFDFNINFIFLRGNTRITKNKADKQITTGNAYFRSNCNSFKLEFIYD